MVFLFEILKHPLGCFSLLLVAGSGFEPESGGYEPPEVPLLYPAVWETLYQKSVVFQD